MVVVRLAKSGAKKNPYYFITVADSRKPRDGGYIERLGFFNPSAKGSEERLRFNLERFDHWVTQGAQASDKVSELVKDARLSPEDLQVKLDAKKAKRIQKKEVLAAQKAAELAAQAEADAKEEAEAAPSEEVPAEEAAAVDVVEDAVEAVSDVAEDAVKDAVDTAKDAVDVAKASVGVGSFTPQGTIRVTAPSSFGRMHVVPGLKGFTEQYPALKVDLRQSDSVVDMVEGGFDIALRNASLSDSTLVARKLARDKRLICAAPSYIKQHGEPKVPKDLLTHQCINLIGIDSWLFNTPQGQEKIKPEGAIRIDNGESIRDACIDGAGITITSVWCAYQALKAGTLVEILTDYPLASETDIWAVYPSSRLLAPKVRVFIEYFKAYFGEVPYWEK